MPDNIEAVLVELDCLLDTRLGTIARLDPEAAVRLLLEGYHHRDSDVFAGVDEQAFKQLYKDRDEKTLMASSLTNMVFALSQLTSGLTEQIISRPFHNGVELVINLHPYQLSEEVQNDIGRAVAARINEHCPVRLVNISPEQLTPQLVKASYAMMVMYDYGTWLNIQGEAFKQCQIREVTLVAPAIYFNEVPDPETLRQLIANNQHPMQAITKLAAPLVGLDLIAPEFFSILSVNRLRPDVINPTQNQTASNEVSGSEGST